MIFLFCSCSDDALDSERIIGSWNLKSVTVTNCQNADENLPKSEADGDNCIVADAVNDIIWCDFVLSVLSDGTGNINYIEDGDTETEEFTYTVNDETGEINFCEDSDCISAEFRGDKLIWILDDEDDCIGELEFTM